MDVHDSWWSLDADPRYEVALSSNSRWSGKDQTMKEEDMNAECTEKLHKYTKDSQLLICSPPLNTSLHGRSLRLK